MSVLSFLCFLRDLLRVYDGLSHSLYIISGMLIFCVTAALYAQLFRNRHHTQF
jgi:hypothetical protein